MNTALVIAQFQSQLARISKKAQRMRSVLVKTMRQPAKAVKERKGSFGFVFAGGMKSHQIQRLNDKYGEE